MYCMVHSMCNSIIARQSREIQWREKDRGPSGIIWGWKNRKQLIWLQKTPKEWNFKLWTFPFLCFLYFSCASIDRRITGKLSGSCMFKLELNWYDIKKRIDAIDALLFCRFSYFIEILVQYLVQHIPGNISLSISALHSKHTITNILVALLRYLVQWWPGCTCVYLCDVTLLPRPPFMHPTPRPHSSSLHNPHK